MVQVNGCTLCLRRTFNWTHPIDNEKLILTLLNLRDVGNSVIVVEHDESIMNAADHIIDLGPRAGENGGMIVAEGNISKIKKANNR